MRAHLFIRFPYEPDFQFFEESSSGNCRFHFVDFWKKNHFDFQVQKSNKREFPLHFSDRIPNEISKENYLKLIEKTISKIKEGNLGKIVISRAKIIHQKIDVFSFFEKLVSKYPSGCVYLFSYPEIGTWIGATPELLLEQKGDEISTVSLAGTRHQNDSTPFLEKEKIEQQLVTDFIASIFKENPFLNKVKIGEPKVSEAGNLQHLKTEISAETKSNFQMSDLLEKLHPTPAVAGFPRKKSLQFIHKNENYDRLFYSGYFGLESDRKSQFFVNLRCAQIFENKIAFYAGGGITEDSDLLSEWEETEVKMGTLLELLS